MQMFRIAINKLLERLFSRVLATHCVYAILSIYTIKKKYGFKACNQAVKPGAH
jgi:hypothetical protein